MIDIRGNTVQERFTTERRNGNWVVIDTTTSKRVYLHGLMMFCETCVERLSGRYDGMTEQWFQHYRVAA